MTDQATHLALKQLASDVSRKLNLNKYPAILGDANGTIYDPQNPGSGYVLARLKTSNGLGTSVKVRGPYAGAPVTMRPGVPVELEYDKDGILYVARVGFQDSLAVGSNPLSANASDGMANSFVAQTDITTLLSHPTAPPTTSVAVRGWKPVISGTFYDFPGALVDMSGFIPTAGNHRVAVIFLKSDFSTIEVKASTAKSTADPIMPADIQEAITARTAGSLALWAWRLHDAQTTIVDADRFLDLRQVFNTNDGPGTGTVTSVGSGAGLSGGPITTSGTLLATPAFLIPARAAATSNVTVASPGATIDSLSLSSGDRVLLTGQSTGAENGLWVWNGAAVPMTRPTDFASGSTVLAYQYQWVYIQGGSVNPGTLWVLTTAAPITIDTTAQAWSLIGLNGQNEQGAVILSPSTAVRNTIQPTANVRPLTVKGSVGQSAALTHWQDSSANVLVAIGSGGAISSVGQITSTAGALLSSLDGGIATIQGKAWGTGNYVYLIGSSARGTQASPTATQDADNLMVFGGRGYPNVGFDSGVLAFKAVGAHSVTAAGASASIFTTPSGTLAQQQSLLISDVGVITQLIINATTAAADDVITANHRSTGTPAAGFGSAIRFLGQSASVNDRNMGRVRAVWNVATDAIRTADLYGTASDSGGDRDGWRIRADGTGAIFDVLAGQRHAVRVVTAAGAVTVTNQDYTVEVNKSVGAATTVNLPAGATGQVFCIKDGKGDANTNNITITPAAGNIDNAGTYVINVAKGGAMIQYDGTMWIVLCKI